MESHEKASAGVRKLALLLYACLIVIALAVPFLLGQYPLRILDMLVINAIAVLGLYVVVGLTGQVSFATSAFWAIGAYASVLLEMHLHFPFLVGLIAATVVGAIVAYLFGIPFSRLTSHYFAFATIGVTMVIFMLLMNWIPLTGGSNGITGVPFAKIFGYQFKTELSYYFLALVFLALSIVLTRWLTRSKLGRSFLAVKGSEVAAESVGINVRQTKAYALGLSGAYGALSGVLYAHLMGFLSPDPFTFDQSVTFLIMLMIGGMNHVWGVVTGTIVLTILPEWLRFLKDYYMLIYGLGVIALMVFMPEGLVGLFLRLTRRQAELKPQEFHREPVSLLPVVSGGGGDTDGELLRVDNLVMNFGGLIAVNDVSLRCARRAVHGIIGPNGSGKTTFINVVSGVYRPPRGRIIFEGNEITGKSQHEIAKLGIARTFQNIRLFKDLTAVENVMIGSDIRPAGRDSGGVDSKRKWDYAMQFLDFVGLSAHAEWVVKNLPYGDQRLVEIARALATRPRLILLDEPAAGMNPTETATLTSLITRIRDLGVAAVVIEHNMRLIMAACDTITVMNFGRKISEGEPSVVREDEGVIEAYLGRRQRRA